MTPLSDDELAAREVEQASLAHERRERLAKLVVELPPSGLRRVALGDRAYINILLDESDQRAEETANLKRRSWQVLLAGLLAAVVGGIFQIATAIVSRTPSVSGPSTCVVALRNVQEASDRGMKKDSPQMAAINPDDVDRQCGTEQEILASIGR